MAILGPTLSGDNGKRAGTWRKEALNRTQPILPLAPGVAARQSHDYEDFMADRRSIGNERRRDVERRLGTSAPDGAADPASLLISE